MITKNAAVAAILTEALASLEIRAAKNELQPGDTTLLESLWRCSFTSHTKYDRDAVETFSRIINYGGTAPTPATEDDSEKYTWTVTNAAKWIDKWEICPEITAKLKAAAAEEAAKKKAEEEAAKKKEAEEAAKKKEAEETAKKEEVEETAKVEESAAEEPAQETKKGAKKKAA